jgi:hypothetical protein
VDANARWRRLSPNRRVYPEDSVFSSPENSSRRPHYGLRRPSGLRQRERQEGRMGDSRWIPLNRQRLSAHTRTENWIRRETRHCQARKDDLMEHSWWARTLVASATLTLLSLGLSASGSGALGFRRFFGPQAAVWWSLPECGYQFADVSLVETQALAYSSSAGPCNSALARPASYLTVDMTQTFNTNGAPCPSTANSNSAGDWRVSLSSGCSGFTGGYRSSHWYRFNNSWVYALCGRPVNGNAVCPF